MPKQIGRLLTAMVTPFDENGEVDYPQVRKLAIALVKSGSDGLVVSGTTGESPSLSIEEKLRLFSECKFAVGNTASIVAGTGSNNTRESIELTKEASLLDIDAIMIVVPYYNKPPQEGLYQHFLAIAESTHLPLIPYNVPSRTGLNMTADTTIRLSKIDNIIGVKEASSDLDQISRIISSTDNDFLVWSGNDNETFQIMCMGGSGVISVASHLTGNQIRKMMDLIISGKINDAAKEHHRLLPLFKGIFSITSPIPIKYTLNKCGFNVGPTRLPLVQPDSETVVFLDNLLRNYSIDIS
jgi:4-hydroxy-tetrahydrodipicolinate synthase